MCCHPVDGVHWKGEPDDCCHIHAEDLAANEEPKRGVDALVYQGDLRSVPDGITAQTANQRLSEGLERFNVCATCGMEVSTTEQHVCPALAGARSMQEHIPPKEFRPRQTTNPTEGPAEPA